jgi:hypothetical protein
MFERFSNFEDSLFSSISISYADQAKTGYAELTVLTRDFEAGGKWVHVVIKIRNVQEYRIVENPRNPIRVLSNGLFAMEADGRLWIVFDSADPPTTAAEARNAVAHICGSAIELTIRE